MCQGNACVETMCMCLGKVCAYESGDMSGEGIYSDCVYVSGARREF
jgi:hypothetical protein